MRTLLLAAIFAFTSVAAQTLGDKPSEPADHPLSMTIAPEQPSSAAHQATQFTITFTNTSQGTLSFAPGTTIHCGIRPSKTAWVKLNLTDPKGKLYRHLDYMGDGPPYIGACAGRVELFIVTLRPHESIALPLDLSKYVDLSDAKQFEMTRCPAGTYSVEAEFTSVWNSPPQDKKTSWIGTVKSNTIQIKFASEFGSAYVEPR